EGRPGARHHARRPAQEAPRLRALNVRRLAWLPLLLACSHPPAKAPAPPEHYADERAWLCLPGRDDACARNADATEIAPDGTRVVVRDTPAPGADKVDCFYVYPTVDLRMGSANHDDFRDSGPMARATFVQAARFRSACRLFVPLYRQITFGTYLRSAETKKPYTDVAFSDVRDAFAQYLSRYNEGRKIVVLGHSQG